MTGSTNWWDIPLLLILPPLVLLVILILFVYWGRGRRSTSINLSGFGVTLRIDSREQVEKEKAILTQPAELQ